MKHSPEEWKEVIKEFKESGLSQRKWCAIYDEDRNSLQYWILRFQYFSRHYLCELCKIFDFEVNRAVQRR